MYISNFAFIKLLNKVVAFENRYYDDQILLINNKAKECVSKLKNGLGINIHLYDESEIFFSRSDTASSMNL